MNTTFEAVVQAMKSDDYGESGLYQFDAGPGGSRRSRYSRLDLGDEALKEFHIGQTVRVTVEAVEE